MNIANLLPRRGVIAAAVLTAGITLAGSAFAESCPSNQMRPDGSGEKMNSTPASGVTDNVLTSIDLAKEQQR